MPIDTAYALGTSATLAAPGRRPRRRRARPRSPARSRTRLRRSRFAARAAIQLPPVYYGTIDATPLWICCCTTPGGPGHPTAEVEALLPTLEAALRWIRSATPTSDGFLELHRRERPRAGQPGLEGLARPTGSPTAASRRPDRAVRGAGVRVRGGAERRGAARRVRGPDADRTGAGPPSWPTGSGSGSGRTGHDRFPAIALDGNKRPVDIPDLQHRAPARHRPADRRGGAAVARLLAGPELDSGCGLRTMSSAPRRVTTR